MTGRDITMDLMGGLGNQMFQYAAGKALAIRTGSQLLLNTRPLATDALRSYALDMFGIPEQLMDVPTPHIHRWQRMLNKIYPIDFTKIIVKEPHFHYWEKFADLRPGVHLHGYWASPRYFAGYEEQIRQAFVLPEISSSAAVDIKRKIHEVESVSVHLRRGDYLTATISAVHGNLDLQYYAHACKLISRMFPDCRFFVFSDDPPAARAFFKEWKNAIFVETGSQSDDLHLMSCCRHHVIANSTFSWWGAWLAGNDSGVVVAPRNWFAREMMLRCFVLDLIPQKWILL